MANTLSNPLFLFLHLPKCAGTSLLKMFSTVGPKHCVTVAENKSKQLAFEAVRQQMVSKRIRPDQLRLIQGRNVLYGMHEMSPDKSPFYFTFVREPVERFVSQFAYYEVLADNPRHAAHEMATARIGRGANRMTLEQFVADKQGINMMSRALASAWLPPEDEVAWWHAPKDQCRQPAIHMLDQMSFIGLVENFDADSKLICQKIGIRPPQARLNQSKKVDISDSLRRQIEQLVADDLEVYEHARTRSAQLRNEG